MSNIGVFIAADMQLLYVAENAGFKHKLKVIELRYKSSLSSAF